MTRILVSGLINIENTAAVDGFPIPYFPVRFAFFGVRSSVSGVGYNVAKALSSLGDDVRLLSFIGHDAASSLVRLAFAADGLSPEFLSGGARETPQSVILYEPSGRRQIHVDLKDVQEIPVPEELPERALAFADVCALCNINFSRPLLSRARREGKLIATDVHVLSDVNDAYNRDFLSAADILFLSDESLPGPPHEVARELIGTYGNRIVVIGMGEKGALLALREGGSAEIHPAVTSRPVVNTIGAGDALFSAFLHLYVKTKDPRLAIRGAILFASHKIGTAGAAEGFLTEPELMERIR
ncbi:MAG: hypothetical protein DIJKHBIC_03860 [Thermoanaerobaculia bacterium]|nr:hypothetical protein [Thermoanaerobaculia bacterium]